MSTATGTASPTQQSDGLESDAPSPRQAASTFSGDDAAFVSGLRGRLDARGLTMTETDAELVSEAKELCSISSSGGALHEKINVWFGQRRLGDQGGILLDRAVRAYCPQYTARLTIAQQRSDDGLSTRSPSVQADFLRYVVGSLGATAEPLLARSDDRMSADVRAVCAAVRAGGSPAALARAAGVDASDLGRGSVGGAYVVGAVLVGCEESLKDVGAALGAG